MSREETKVLFLDLTGLTRRTFDMETHPLGRKNFTPVRTTVPVCVIILLDFDHALKMLHIDHSG